MNEFVRSKAIVCALSGVLAALVFEPVARAEAKFGDPGVVTIGGATSMAFTHSHLDGGSDSTSLFLDPAVDVFVVRGLSLGAVALYQHVESGGAFNYLAFGPRVGFNVPLDDHWSIWPTVSGAYGIAWGGFDGSPSSSWELAGFAPVLYHPAPHFYVGAV